MQDAPRFGAERRGAPLFASVRAARRPIRERGRVRCPDLVVVADDTLVPIAAAGVLEGIDGHTWLLIRSEVDAAEWERRLGRSGQVRTLSAAGPDAADPASFGASCAGGAARLVRGISLAALERALAEELAGLPAAALERSRRQLRAAWDQLGDAEGSVLEGPDAVPAGARPAWVELPFEPVGRSAPAVRAPATSVQVRTGLWRTQRPVIDPDLCRGCSWVCSTFCPDGAIAVTPAGRPSIDYDHCKGCLVCVAVCPAHAIRVEPEHPPAAREEARP